MSEPAGKVKTRRTCNVLPPLRFTDKVPFRKSSPLAVALLEAIQHLTVKTSKSTVRLPCVNVKQVDSEKSMSDLDKKRSSLDKLGF